MKTNVNTTAAAANIVIAARMGVLIALGVTAFVLVAGELSPSLTLAQALALKALGFACAGAAWLLGRMWRDADPSTFERLARWARNEARKADAAPNPMAID